MNAPVQLAATVLLDQRKQVQLCCWKPRRFEPL